MRSIDTLTRSISGPEEFFRVLHPIPGLDRRWDAFEIDRTESLNH